MIDTARRTARCNALAQPCELPRICAQREVRREARNLHDEPLAARAP